MSDLPTGTPTEFEVKRVEVKKELPAKDDRPPAVILKLGLRAGDAAGWAEHYAPTTDPAKWPGEGRKETFVIEPSEKPEWLPKAKRPRKGGGMRQRDPKETQAIQRQHSQEMALRWLAVQVAAGEPPPQTIDTVAELTDWFEADISGGAKQ